MPRFSIRRTLAVGSLRAFLRLEAGVGHDSGPSDGAERLADGLQKARRTSQKRAKRIRALKAELAELRAARAEDARLLDYLLSDAFRRRGPWVTGVRVGPKTSAGRRATRAPACGSSSGRSPKPPGAGCWSRARSRAP
ncbi:MAG: hypothetical protein M3Q49_20115 [Actinomycetota bacterium]|nr:hypothetical protein [Actinomycetota bacterium]